MVDIDYQTKILEITEWIRKTVAEPGFSDVVVAVSGGIDSAVSLALCVRALGKEHVYALRLPYGKFSTAATMDAKIVTSSVGLRKEHVFQKDIYKEVNKIVKQINDPEMSSVRKGNIMARVRMIFLYDLTKSLNALVVGTENKSEYLLGYFTRFGDEASDIEPIRNLYKTQVRELAKALGLPQEIINKQPTAGLWDGQTDEKEFGFTYADADRVLYYHFDEGLCIEAIVELGIEKQIVESVLRWVQKNEFKHHLPKILQLK